MVGGAVIGDDAPGDEVQLGSIPLLETPPGEQSAPSPRLLGYGSYGAGGAGYGGYGTGYPPYSGGEMVMMAGGAHVGIESLAQAAVILVIGVAIIISNIIILATFITMPGKDTLTNAFTLHTAPPYTPAPSPAATPFLHPDIQSYTLVTPC